MDNEYKQALINEFINNSFRDTADQDYISARILIRNNLFNQFYWASQQSIEKYLKAILLYNYKSAKFGHDLMKIFESIKKNIPDLNFNLPNNVIDFIKLISSLGNNRYVENSYAYFSLFMVQLDQAVWYIRKYCRYLREKTVFDQENNIDTYYTNVLNLNYGDKIPYNFNINNGFLEKVLLNDYLNLRKGLIWKNYFYGKHTRKKMSFITMSGSVNSILAMYDEIYPLLKDKVKFSEDVKQYYDNKNTVQNGT